MSALGSSCWGRIESCSGKDLTLLSVDRGRGAHRTLDTAMSQHQHRKQAQHGLWVWEFQPAHGRDPSLLGLGVQSWRWGS